MVFFSLEMQRRLVQTKVYYKLSYSVWKETSHKRLTNFFFKSSSCKKGFLGYVYHWYNLLRWILFVPCDNWKTLFFYTNLLLPIVLVNRYVAVSIETSVLKEVRILYRYLHNNIKMLLILKVHNKAFMS